MRARHLFGLRFAGSNQEGKNSVVRLIATKPTPNEQKAKE
jgi:hypothetical protein